MVLIFGLASGKDAGNVRLLLVIDPQSTHGVVHAGENLHRRVARIVAHKLLVDFQDTFEFAIQNLAIDMGQVEGGFLQGVGWLTSEELWWDSKGELKTHAPSTYKIPTARDWPAQARVRLLEGAKNSEETIYRSKAVGEPPLMLAISVLHAIRDAVASCGAAGAIPQLSAPATPETVLGAINALRGGARR